MIVQDNEKFFNPVYLGPSSNEQELFQEPVELRSSNELREEDILAPGEAPDDFSWIEDFANFKGARDIFKEVAGPKFEGTSPVDLFTQLWDRPFIEMIVRETNSYAWDTIARASEIGIPDQSRLNEWVETTVSEIYRLLAVMVAMGVCFKDSIEDYWSTDIWGVPKFRNIITSDRFTMLMRFLHFSDNNEVTLGHDHKIAKIKPIVDYLNAKFKAAYTPRREVAVYNSLLLWEGDLSWEQLGVKSNELCEAVTGYCLTIDVCFGKSASQEPMLGFTGASAKTVLKLMTGYLDKGYTLFIDNFYNSVPLARYLKSRHTDVVGTLNRRRIATPADIRNVTESSVLRGAAISRHCGDVSVISWKDYRLVTMVSTYHNAEMMPRLTGGNIIVKPCAVQDYDSFMGGMYLKDQKLSPHPLERKRGLKWYIKIFCRLLNVSISNSYIIYCANMGQQRKLSQPEFRYRLILELLNQSSHIHPESGVHPSRLIGELLMPPS